jgi:hypothetical protein
MLATLLLDDPEMEPKVRALIDADHLVSGPMLARRLDLAAQLSRRAGRNDDAVRFRDGPSRSRPSGPASGFAASRRSERRR